MDSSTPNLTDLDTGGTSKAKMRERRAAPRHPRHGHLRIFPIVAGRAQPAISVTCKDISAIGMGFHCVNRLARGSQFIMGLVRPPSQITLMLFNVIRCDQHATKGKEIGVALVATLRNAEIAMGKTFPGIDLGSAPEQLLKSIEEEEISQRLGGR